jgi:MYXO-CTERM domain-containing protein
LLARRERRVEGPLEQDERERARLRAHFREVLAELRARDVTHLSEPARAARARLVSELSRYARTGRFPRNLDFPSSPTPYFIDAFGVRCAMAHLIESTGEARLVARVAATMNNALVRDLEADIELTRWLEQAGLTAAEAARIQPSYCFITKGEECLCNRGGGSLTIAEATVTGDAGGGDVVARIDVVHGDMSIVTVGQEVTVDSTSGVGGVVLLSAGRSATGMPWYSFFDLIKQDGTVELSCNLEVPALKKQDAIDALLAGGGSPESIAKCTEKLTAIDSRWGESQCEDGEGGGCAVTAPPAGSPVLFGALFVAAAAWARRRRRGAQHRRFYR